MTVTVGEAFDAMGYALKSEETVCVATNIGGRFVEQSLHDVADEPIGANRYYSTGTFPKGTRWGKGSRSQKNVLRILELPLDFDFKDFLGQDKDDLLTLSDDELTSYIQPLQQAVEEIIGKLSLPIHRLDYTGYGLSAHISLPPHKQDSVKILKDLHAGLVEKINSLFGGIIADVQVKDAGTRIMRLVPCLNVGELSTGEMVPGRTSFTIYRKDGYISESMLRNAAEKPAWKVGKTIPVIGESLEGVDAQVIVDAYKPFHIKGQKHFHALAIAGQLGKAGVTEEQTMAIVSAIAEDDNKPWDRQKAVRDTYDKLRNGQDVIGYYALKNLVSEDAISAVDSILNKIRKRQGPKLVLINSHQEKNGKEPKAVKRFNPLLTPDECFYGWHREWRDLVSPTTGASDAFHLAASLTGQAAMMGRRIAVKYASQRIFPNMFSVVLGPTGNSFKDTAYNRFNDARNYMKDMRKQSGISMPLQNDYHEVRDFASRESMIRELVSHSNVYLFSSEFVAILKNASRDSTSTLLDGLIHVWDAPAFMENSSLSAKKNEENIAHNPTVNIFGGIQPDRMAKEMSENVMTSGMGNRLSIFMGVSKGRMSNPPDFDLRAGAMHIERLKTTIDGYAPNERELRMSSAAVRVWDDWYNSVEFPEDETAADMMVRHPLMIQKWSLMFAVSDGSRTIEIDHLQPAIMICEWMWKNIQMLLPSWGVSEDRKIEERIITVLSQRQPMLKRDLNRYVRGKWSAGEFARVFGAMKANQQIVMDASDQWVALADFKGVLEQAS